MWPASIFVVAAYIRGDIWRTLKHPLLVGVKTWAVAHLISNGDLGSIVLFGSFLAWAVYDRITLKRRSDPGAPAIPADGRRRDSSRSRSAPSFTWRSVSSSIRSWSVFRCSAGRLTRVHEKCPRKTRSSG